MHALRSTAIIIFVALGIVAASGAVLWSASLAGLARVEIVATSALAPSFEAGDLVLATTVPAGELERGDVVSVTSAGALPGRLERVLEVEARDGGGWVVTSAARNGGETTTASTLGSTAWAPSLRVPLVGGVLAAAVEPRNAIPVLAIVMVLGTFVLIGRAPSAPVRRHA